MLVSERVGCLSCMLSIPQLGSSQMGRTRRKSRVLSGMLGSVLRVLFCKEQMLNARVTMQLFRPMPVGNLSHPVFQSDQRVPLELPIYRPVCFHRRVLEATCLRTCVGVQEALTHAAVGTAMAFPDKDSKALKAYGLPTNVLVDVSAPFRPAEAPL